MALGPESLLVAVRLDLKDGVEAEQIEKLSAELRRELPDVVPSVTSVFLDASPGHDGDRADEDDRPATPSAQAV